jgi:hypothetical protein
VCLNFVDFWHAPMHKKFSRLGRVLRPDYEPRCRHSHSPEHPLVTPPLKRLIGSLMFVLPALALATSPVMAAKPKHHSSVHKISAHKSHTKKTTAPTAS